MLDWGGAALTGNYTLLANQIDSIVIEPDGSTPTEGSVASHRYHHHTLTESAYGKIFVAYSSGAVTEETSGEQTVVSWSGDSGETWSSPQVMAPAQSFFVVDGTRPTTGTRWTRPRCFVKTIGGDLYLVAAIDEMGVPENVYGTIGKALVAAKMNADGSVGMLYRISPGDYDPLPGFAAIPYDAGIAALTFEKSKLFGTWGGSAPEQTPSEWNWMTAPGQNYRYWEPSTVDLGGGLLLRTWRAILIGTAKVHQSVSNDGGKSFGPIYQTNVPNSPSASYIFDIPGKGVVLIGNPRTNVIYRDPLFLAIFDRVTWKLKSVSAIRQGVSDVATYPDPTKIGAAAYPSAVIVGDYLHVSYSINKEKIAHSRIPLASIP